MTTTAHTSGKWHFEDEGGRFLPLFAGTDENEIRIAEIFRLDEELGDPLRDAEALANATLIAAAPKLLAALKALAEFWQHGTPIEGDALAAIEARAVIAIAAATQ